MFFLIPNEKSPGADGYSSGFFKAAWEDIGPLVCNAVQEFFTTGQFCRGYNATNLGATNLVVLPKTTHPITAADFRPISCCNVVYKSISKVICIDLKSSSQQ